MSSPWARAQFRILCATPPPQLRLQAASLYRHLGQTGVRGRPGGARLSLTSTPDQKGPGEGSLSGESLLHLHQEAQQRWTENVQRPHSTEGEAEGRCAQKSNGEGVGHPRGPAETSVSNRNPSPTITRARPRQDSQPSFTLLPRHTNSVPQLRTCRHTCTYVPLSLIYHLSPRPQPPASAP